MKKLFALFVAVFVALSACNHYPAPLAPSEASPAIAQLEINGVLACTTFKLGERWATAKHCTEDDAGQPYALLRVNGHMVTGVDRDPDDDVAYLAVDAPGLGYHLANGLPPPVYGPKAEEICFVGYPQYGGLTHFGTYCGRYNGLDKDGDIKLGEMVDGGASGSPLFNSSGEVIGVVVSSFRRTNYSYAEPLVK